MDPRGDPIPSPPSPPHSSHEGEGGEQQQQQATHEELVASAAGNTITTSSDDTDYNALNNDVDDEEYEIQHPDDLDEVIESDDEDSSASASGNDAIVSDHDDDDDDDDGHDDHDDDSDSNEQPETVVPFDRSITGEHSYLHGAERTLRRQFIEPCSRIVIPIVPLQGVCVFPGDVVPLLVDAQHTLMRLLSITSPANRSVTFGALGVDLHSRIFSRFGSVAEVRVIRGDDDTSGTLLSKARQRFRVIHFLTVSSMQHVTEHEGHWNLGDVVQTINPLSDEQSSTDPAAFVLLASRLLDSSNHVFAYVEMLDDYDPPAQSRSHSSIMQLGSKKQLDVTVTQFEPWVYRLYDTEELANKARALLDSIFPAAMARDRTASSSTATSTTTSTTTTTSTATSATAPSSGHGRHHAEDEEEELEEAALASAVAHESPCELSFWIAANLPLPLRVRLQLLATPTTLLRLQREIELLLSMDQLYCDQCSTPLASRSDMIQMTSDGWRSAFVNPHGYVHEALTLRRMQGLRLIGRPSTESSWFPGYAWTIAQCARCSAHIGWRFTACRNDLSPSVFYGVSMASVRSVLQK